jgi:hypothetical protein
VLAGALFTITCCNSKEEVLYYRKVDDPSDSLKIAIVGMDSPPTKFKCIEYVKQISNEILDNKPETELICFPNIMTPFFEKPEYYMTRIGDTIPGQITDSIAQICSNRNVTIYFELYENRNDTYFITGVIIDTAGVIIGVQRNNTVSNDWALIGFGYEQNSNVIEMNSFKIGLCTNSWNDWLISQYLIEDIDILIYASDDVNSSLSRRLDCWIICPDDSYIAYAPPERQMFVYDPLGDYYSFLVGELEYPHAGFYGTYTIYKGNISVQPYL